MIDRLRLTVTWLAAVVLTCTTASAVSLAAEKSAADLLPRAIVAYAEIQRPRELIDLVLDHPIRTKVESLEAYRQALDTPQYREFLSIVDMVEDKLGMDLRPALSTAAEGGIYAGVDLASQGIIVLVKSSDAEMLQSLVKTAVDLADQQAADTGGPAPKAKQYRGLDAYEIGEAVMAVVDDWLVVANQPRLGKLAVDSYLDGGLDPLSGDKEFQRARDTIVGEPAAWAFTRVGVLRLAGVAKDLFAEKTDNPAVEVVLGGLLSTLRFTPFATASLYADDAQLRLAIAAPHRADWVGKHRHYYFGADGDGRAPPAIAPDDTLLSVRTYRDLGAMWLSSPDLYKEEVASQLAQADSGLTTLFAGRDFGREVLGSLQPQLQLVAARQQFDADEKLVPDLKLPSFGIVLRLKDPDTMQRQLKMSYQSLIGFLNIVGAQQGQPQLEMDMRNQDGATVVSAHYAFFDEEPTDSPGRIHYNFSPSIAYVDDHFVVASTSRFAAELIRLAKAEPSQPAARDEEPTENTAVEVNVDVLREVLADNREQLIAQTMLDEGFERAQAEQQVDTLMELIGWVRAAALRLGTTDESVSVELELSLVEQP